MMDIKLFNSYSNQVEIFKPIQPNLVTMYVCGPTVYDHVHIGNVRPVVVFDVLKKLFLALNYQVKHVSNFTDIDDRIIAKAQKEQLDEATITRRYIDAYLKVIEQVKALAPDVSPTVTEHIPAMIAFIQQLITDGYAYQTNRGDVYFRVHRIKNYGHLSHTHIEELNAGSRIEVDSLKEDPLDFALWKKTTTGISFDSPFGSGRPGWHTECVVMIAQTFHQTLIDIHGGGFDLKFPHHDNEIAQAQAAYRSQLANYWLHNGFINLASEKMSKSTGNILLAKDFLAQYGGPLLRYLLLATHYRMPVNITQVIIDNARQELDKIHTTYNQVAVYLQLQNQSLEQGKAHLPEEFLLALCDDINTANALTVLQTHIKEVNVGLRQGQPDLKRLSGHFFTIKAMLAILGLDLKFTILTPEDRQLYAEFVIAKQQHNFVRSDELRKILNQRQIFFS
jgi:cysteinyl-tRNA synthetase